MIMIIDGKRKSEQELRCFISRLVLLLRLLLFPCRSLNDNSNREIKHVNPCHDFLFSSVNTSRAMSTQSLLLLSSMSFILSLIFVASFLVLLSSFCMTSALPVVQNVMRFCSLIWPRGRGGAVPAVASLGQQKTIEKKGR